jgi:mRNA interferase RelE/StbE
LSKLPKEEIEKILAKISGLAKTPRPSGFKTLQGELKGLHRIRSGNYRIVYRINDTKLIILVIRVAHRGKVYE